MDNLIFISGATGTIGKRLLKELQGKARIKAGSHNEEKIARLLQMGIEAVPFDFNHPGLMLEALQGVKTLFLLTGDTEIFDRQVQNALQAARQAGVQHVVRISTLGISNDPNDPCMLMHRKGEDHVRESGLNWTIIKPNYFMDNIIENQRNIILNYNKFYGAAGTGRVSFISSWDIAACAAQILLEPEKHYSKTYRLTGPQALSFSDVAGLLSKLLERNIEFVNLRPEQHAEGLRANGMADWLIQSMVFLEICVRDGKFDKVTDDVSRILSRPPEHFESFLNREFMEEKTIFPQ